VLVAEGDLPRVLAALEGARERDEAADDVREPAAVPADEPAE
jgi:hypothetical protein